MGFILQIEGPPKPGYDAKWRSILSAAFRNARFETDDDVDLLEEISLPREKLRCATPSITRAELEIEFGLTDLNPAQFGTSRFKMCIDVAGTEAYDMWSGLLPEDAVAFGRKLIAAADAADRRPVAYSLRHLGTPITTEMIWTTRAIGALAIYYGERGCALWVR